MNTEVKPSYTFSSQILTKLKLDMGLFNEITHKPYFIISNDDENLSSTENNIVIDTSSEDKFIYLVFDYKEDKVYVKVPNILFTKDHASIIPRIREIVKRILNKREDTTSGIRYVPGITEQVGRCDSLHNHETGSNNRILFKPYILLDSLGLVVFNENDVSGHKLIPHRLIIEDLTLLETFSLED